jgi:hypothetical protein
MSTNVPESRRGSADIGSAWTVKKTAVKKSALKEVNCIFD